MFCDKTETAFVELLCWTPDFAMARETHTTGVCADHANLMPQGLGPFNGAELPPAFEERKPVLIALHKTVHGEGHGDAYTFGLRYHAKDSITGRDVRLRRMGMTNPLEATVHNPLQALPVERVTSDEFEKAMGDDPAAKGKIFG